MARMNSPVTSHRRITNAARGLLALLVVVAIRAAFAAGHEDLAIVGLTLLGVAVPPATPGLRQVRLGCGAILAPLLGLWILDAAGVRVVSTYSFALLMLPLSLVLGTPFVWHMFPYGSLGRVLLATGYVVSYALLTWMALELLVTSAWPG